MANSDELRLRNLVRQRIAHKRSEIDRSLRQIASGNPLGSEPRKERLVARLATKTGMADRDVKAVAEQVQRCAVRIDAAGSARAGAEALQGPSVDFVGVEFLTRGRLAANTAGRVSYRTGRSQGSGFLVGPNLFLTNHHVISTPQQASDMVVEFDYEFDDRGLQRPVTAFAFDPHSCFVYQPTDGLGFVLVAVGSRMSGDKVVESFGFNPLSDAADKHMPGEIANIIQHPGGRPKQLSCARTTSLPAMRPRRSCTTWRIRRKGPQAHPFATTTGSPLRCTTGASLPSKWTTS
jgi:endonuclease G